MKMLGAAMLGLSVMLPFAAYAQMNDADYCSALAAAYRNDHGAGLQTSTEVANALASCGADAKGSIPVLEKALEDEKMPLPKRN